MALVLTEDCIKQKVNLRHDNLEDVKSLSLPGTYQEKAATLGNSLRKFTRLKHLDLSRNVLTSLTGLEHLNLLEKLNLYYNNIASLDELKRLQSNGNLQELDLRLNPVTRNEPDYRLFLIHLLPCLQRLDDRCVRERERQAAFYHFSDTPQMEPTKLPADVFQDRTNPRVEYVKSFTKGITALDDDDVAVLDIIAHTGGDLKQQRHLGGSSAKQAAVEEYSFDSLKKLEAGEQIKPGKDNVQLDPSGQMPQLGLQDMYLTGMHQKIVKPASDIPVDAKNAFVSSQPQQNSKPITVIADEYEAYIKNKNYGNFTPCPELKPIDLKSVGNYQKNAQDLLTQTPVECDPLMHQCEAGKSVQSQHLDSMPRPSTKNQHFAGGDNHLTANDQANVTHFDYFLLKLLDLVDKYWNGAHSLHRNPKFKSIAKNLIEKYIQECENGQRHERDYLQEQIVKLTAENTCLRERRLASQTADENVSEPYLKASLKDAYRDLEELQAKLHLYVKENQNLQQQLKSHESVAANSVNQSQIEAILNQNQGLRQDIEMFRSRLKQYDQMQELTKMLQESHLSLMKTNDHLLKELEETRHRHHCEVQQLQWGHEQLKQSMNSFVSFSQSTSNSPPGSLIGEPPKASVRLYDNAEKESLGQINVS